MSEPVTGPGHAREAWRVRLDEVIAYWKGAGYRTAVLERALRLPSPPDVQGLIATYVQAIHHLRALARQATRVDPALGEHELFRDPERLREAEDLVEGVLIDDPWLAHPAAALGGDAIWRDRARVVWDWGDITERLIETLR